MDLKSLPIGTRIQLTKESKPSVWSKWPHPVPAGAVGETSSAFCEATQRYMVNFPPYGDSSVDLDEFQELTQ